MTKTCSTCKQTLAISDFTKKLSQRDGLNGQCKECCHKYRLTWWKKNAEREKIKNKSDESRAYHRDYHRNRYRTDIGYKETIKASSRANREYFKDWSREFKLKKPLAWRLKSRSSVLSRTLRKVTMGLTGDRFNKDLGCTYLEHKSYLESLFLPGMNWENYGRKEDQWQIDHIKPLWHSFEIENKDDQFLCLHFTNTQPLWRRENISKGTRETFYE